MPNLTRYVCYGCAALCAIRPRIKIPCYRCSFGYSSHRRSNTGGRPLVWGDRVFRLLGFHARVHLVIIPSLDPYRNDQHRQQNEHDQERSRHQESAPLKGLHVTETAERFMPPFFK